MCYATQKQFWTAKMCKLLQNFHVACLNAAYITKFVSTLNLFPLITNSREDFICIPELAINPIGERIIDAFFMNEDSK